MTELLSIGQDAIKTIKSHGCEGEIYFDHDYSKSMTLQRGQMKNSEIFDIIGYAIRVKKGDKSTFICSTNLQNIDNVIQQAVESLKFVPENPGLAFTENIAQKPKTDKFFDKRILDIEMDDVIDKLQAMNNQSENVQHLQSFSASYGLSLTTKYILNTNGLEISDRQTNYGYYGSCNLIDGDIVASGSEGKYSHKLENIDTDFIAQEAIRKSKTQLIKETLPTGDYPVILHPHAVGELLGWTLPPALAGDQILVKNSPFIDSMGDQIGSEILNIYDDPISLNFRNSLFDDEGTVRTNPLPIIENGVLKTFIHSNRTAKVMGTESTANAYHWNRYEGHSYRHDISVVPTTFKIQPGTESIESMIEDIKHGLIVDYVFGAHSSEIANGNYSVVAYLANIIKNGEIGPSPHKAMLPGNTPALLKNISAISKEWLPDISSWNYSITSPYLYFDTIDRKSVV